MELALELDDWRVELKDGGVVHVRAAGYSTEHGQVVFVAVARGTPNYEVPLVSFPAESVVDIDGG